MMLRSGPRQCRLCGGHLIITGGDEDGVGLTCERCSSDFELAPGNLTPIDRMIFMCFLLENNFIAFRRMGGVAQQTAAPHVVLF